MTIEQDAERAAVSVSLDDFIHQFRLSATPDIEEIRDGITVAVAGRLAETTKSTYKYWQDRFCTWLADPTTRWRGRHIPPLADPSGIFPIDRRGEEIVEMWIQDMILGPQHDHVAREDWEDDGGPIAPGTLHVVLAALKSASQDAGCEWGRSAKFDHFTAGHLRHLSEQHLTVQARPLLLPELRQIGAWLLDFRCPIAARDGIIVELAIQGWTCAQTARAELLVHHDGGTVITDGTLTAYAAKDSPLDTASRIFLAASNGSPGLGLTTANPRQHATRILRKVAVAAGLTQTSNFTATQTAALRATVHSGAWSPAEKRVIRDHALLLTGWPAMLRRSEIGALNERDAPTTTDGLTVYVRRSKNGKSRTSNVGRSNTPALDPSRAVERWKSVRSTAVLEATDPLFCAIDRHGNLKSERLSGDAIQQIIRQRVLDTGVVADINEAKIFSGHSLRRGAITTAADNEKDIAKLQAMSGHASIAPLIVYIDDSYRRQNPVTSVLNM